jgi:hypothetical protein
LNKGVRYWIIWTRCPGSKGSTISNPIYTYWHLRRRVSPFSWDEIQFKS